ncbi:hypothetical protein RF640_05045 [Kocuria sp. CPCC 205231]|uniref:hypothetical protein n=1 Tax=Kocuria sp. CPCC 205231 TaxID=3073551 RepID=UPI0034D44C8E
MALLATGATAKADGDVLEVTLDGPSITVKINGVTETTATDTFNQYATRFGWAGYNTSPLARWDDFDLSSLPA